MIEKLACNLGRNDEEPNIELANSLCEENNTQGVSEIIEGVQTNNKAVANDCIKVLYEVGAKRPELVADYADVFLSLLSSKNNRLVWGGMIALATIADLKSREIYKQLNIIKKAYETGSVITIDNSMTVFAKLCKANKEYEAEIFPILIQHLETCKPREVPQHSERISICLNKDNVLKFAAVLEERRGHLTSSQIKRIDKLLKEAKKDGIL